MPQIEVTFDIDANGIVKVSAKDLGTGKEQNITITASTNMSKEDIDKAVKEAEQFAADDKKKREEVDIRNGADQMVFQTEKMLKENGDKLPADVKSEAESKLADLKTAVQSGNVDDIKAKQEALSQVFEKMYQAAAAAQQAAGAQPGPDAGANNQQKPGDDGVVDADFKGSLIKNTAVCARPNRRTHAWNNKSRSGFAGAALAGYRARNQPGRFPDQTFPER